MGGCGIGRFDPRSPVFSSQWMDVGRPFVFLSPSAALSLAAAVFCDGTSPPPQALLPLPHCRYRHRRPSPALCRGHTLLPVFIKVPGCNPHHIGSIAPLPFLCPAATAPASATAFAAALSPLRNLGSCLKAASLAAPAQVPPSVPIPLATVLAYGPPAYMVRRPGAAASAPQALGPQPGSTPLWHGYCPRSAHLHIPTPPPPFLRIWGAYCRSRRTTSSQGSLSPSCGAGPSPISDPANPPARNGPRAPQSSRRTVTGSCRADGIQPQSSSSRRSTK